MYVIMFRTKVPASQKTLRNHTNNQPVNAVRETVAVYCENHTEHTDTVCGQDAEFWYVKTGGAYSNHRVLKGLTCVSINRHLEPCNEV
jgi:hypothetical protein